MDPAHTTIPGPTSADPNVDRITVAKELAEVLGAYRTAFEEGNMVLACAHFSDPAVIITPERVTLFDRNKFHQSMFGLMDLYRKAGVAFLRVTDVAMVPGGQALPGMHAVWQVAAADGTVLANFPTTYYFRKEGLRWRIATAITSERSDWLRQLLIEADNG
ncbi:MAG: hypothetical protein OEY97_05655 [Nitrospirota bacterium]|nr:hypothetical protein [Nitrospirota bacterium]